ncbi:hypothetical protein RCL1_008488 [Eukaryota sp. TZLM3-RCL]
MSNCNSPKPTAAKSKMSRSDTAPVNFSARDHVSDTTRWLSVRRQIMNLNDDLETKRQEVKAKEADFARQQVDLDKRHQQLQKDYQDVDNIIQQTFKRRTRAEQIVKNVQTDIKKIDDDMDTMKNHIAVLAADKARIEELTRKNTKYLNYLNAVVAVATEYSTVDALRCRYSTLLNAHENLVERSNNCQTSTDEISAAIASLRDEFDSTTLTYTNHVSKLQTTLDDCSNKVELFQSHLETNKDKTLAERTSQASTESAILSIDLKISHVYSTLFKDHPNVLTGVKNSDLNSCQKLDHIGRLLQDLQQILQRV